MILEKHAKTYIGKMQETCQKIRTALLQLHFLAFLICIFCIVFLHLHFFAFFDLHFLHYMVRCFKISVSRIGPQGANANLI